MVIKKLLNLCAFQTLSMAIYHFYIPYQFKWSNYLSDDIPTINWALYANNNYFSFLLLLISIMMFYFFNSKNENITFKRTLALIGAIFWIFSVIYQLLSPMPLPKDLEWLRSLLIGVAILNFFIFLVAIIKLKKKSNYMNI